jgi:predicted TIM-barrel fold metal-dependent hydrolase
MLSRRRFVVLGAAVAATTTLSGRGSTAVAASKRRLKDIVTGPTFDVEVHLTDAELYTGTEVPDVMPPTQQQLERGMRRFGDASMPGYAENLERYRDYRSRTSIELNAEFLFNELDDAGIDIAVHQMPDHSHKASNIGRYHLAGYERMLEDAIKVRQAYPGRVITMAGIDPRAPREESLRKFEMAVKDYGCKGLGEVVLQQYETYPHDPVMYALYEKCIEFGVPFSGNCEGPAAFTMPNEFEKVAKDLPELKILLAGSGRPRQPSQSVEPISDAIRLANDYENVYLDTADWQRRDREGIELFLSFLRRCFDSDARAKVMYASDFPVLTAMYSTKDWIDVVINQAADYGFSFTDEEITRFYSTNARDFFKDVL